jgi:hypothetical protein
MRPRLLPLFGRKEVRMIQARKGPMHLRILGVFENRHNRRRMMIVGKRCSPLILIAALVIVVVSLVYAFTSRRQSTAPREVPAAQVK